MEWFDVKDTMSFMTDIKWLVNNMNPNFNTKEKSFVEEVSLTYCTVKNSPNCDVVLKLKLRKISSDFNDDFVTLGIPLEENTTREAIYYRIGALVQGFIDDELSAERIAKDGE